MALLKLSKCNILKSICTIILINRVRELIPKLASSEVKSRLSTAIFWGSFATLLGRGLPLVSIMLTARILGAEEFGRFSLLYSMAFAFEVFVTAGLAVTCTKFVADLHRTDKDRTGRIIDLANVMSTITGFLIGSILAIFAPIISKELFRTPELTSSIYGCAILVVLISHSAIHQGILVGMEEFRNLAVVELVGGFSVLIFMPLLSARFGIQGALVGCILAYGFRLSLQKYVVWKKTVKMNIKRSFAFHKAEIVVLWSFSLPAMMNSFIFSFVTWIATAILARHPNGPVEVGIFSAANQWFSLILFLPTILNQAIFPIVTERLNAGDRILAWRLFYGNVIASMISVTIAAVSIGLMSPWIMAFYGSDYALKWPILLIVLIAAWISGPQGPMGNFLNAHGYQWTNFSANACWGVSLIFVVLAFSDYGAIALAWAYVVAYSVKGVFSAVRIAVLQPARMQL